MVLIAVMTQRHSWSSYYTTIEVLVLLKNKLINECCFENKANNENKKRSPNTFTVFQSNFVHTQVYRLAFKRCQVRCQSKARSCNLQCQVTLSEEAAVLRTPSRPLDVLREQHLGGFGCYRLTRQLTCSRRYDPRPTAHKSTSVTPRWGGGVKFWWCLA